MAAWDSTHLEDDRSVPGTPSWAPDVLWYLYFFLSLLCVLTALFRCLAARAHARLTANHDGAAQATPLLILALLFVLFCVRGLTFCITGFQDAPLDKSHSLLGNLLLHSPVFGVLSIISVLSFDGAKVAHQLTLEVDLAEHQLNLEAGRMSKNRSPQHVEAAFAISVPNASADFGISDGSAGEIALQQRAASLQTDELGGASGGVPQKRSARWKTLEGTRGLTTMKHIMVYGYNATMWPCFIVSLIVEERVGQDEATWPESLVVFVLAFYVLLMDACCVCTACYLRRRLVEGMKLEQRWAMMDKTPVAVPGVHGGCGDALGFNFKDSSRVDSSFVTSSQLDLSQNLELSRNASASGRPSVALLAGPDTDTCYSAQGSRGGSVGSFQSRSSLPNRGRQISSRGRPSLPGGEDGSMPVSLNDVVASSARSPPRVSKVSASTPASVEAPLLSLFGSFSSATRSLRPQLFGTQDTFRTQSVARLLGADAFETQARRASIASSVLVDHCRDAQDAIDHLELLVRSRFFWLFVAASVVLVYRGLFLVYLIIKNTLSDGWVDSEMFFYYAVAEVSPMGLLLALIFQEEVLYFCSIRGLQHGDTLQHPTTDAPGAIVEST